MNMAEKKLVKRVNGRALLLGGLLLLQVGLLTAFKPSDLTPTPVYLGFLAKAGSKYIVTWRSEETAPLETSTHEDLGQAIRFASELGIFPSRSIRQEPDAEFVQINDRFGAYVLIWKLPSDQFVHQISFSKRGDAQFFAQAFRQGEYSPSPYGHAIVLRPKSSYK